jgi:uroporphyrinogen decarboxylase
MADQPIKPCREKWAGTMTDRERFNRQMHYKSIDRTFNMEFGYWAENYQQWKMFTENGVKHEWQANQFFNFDHIAGAGVNLWMSPSFEWREIEVRGDKKIHQNGDGLLAEVPVDGFSTIPHYIKSSIETPDDWKKVKAERFRLDSPDRKPNLEDWKKHFPKDRDFPVGVGMGSMIGKIRDMLTFEGLAYATHDYPEMVEDMVETVCQLSEQFLDQALGVIDFDYASGWEDICFKNGPIVSLDFWERVVVPRYERIGRRLAKHGIDIWYIDCDGDVRPLMPGFLKAGVNCLFPYEVNSCVHPGVLLDEYGKDLRIMGGIDKLEMIKGPKAIDAYLASVARLVERGGYIPFCDHRCPPDVTEASYIHYLNRKEEMFGMRK